MSKATALAWEKWRVGHPNWKANPKAKRPRYRMTQRESVEKVAFACEVPADGKPLNILFPVAEVPPLQPEETVAEVETTDAAVPYTIPPLVPPGPPMAEVQFPAATFVTPPFVPPLYGGTYLPPVPRPYVPPVTTPVLPGTPVTGTSIPPVTPVIPLVPVAPVPEPSSLILMAVGLGSTGLAVVRRRSREARAL